MAVNPAKTGAIKTHTFLMSTGKARKSAVHLKLAAVAIMPGNIVPPMTRPRGYQLSLSNQFQNLYMPSWARYLVVLKLNQGSNSWITDSKRIMENTRTPKARSAVRPKITILKMGAHRVTVDWIWLWSSSFICSLSCYSASCCFWSEAGCLLSSAVDSAFGGGFPFFCLPI